MGGGIIRCEDEKEKAASKTSVNVEPWLAQKGDLANILFRVPSYEAY